MGDSIIVAIITGVISLIGTVITVLSQNSKTRTTVAVNQAETRKDIQNLTHEVQKHNNFAQRMPVVEEQIKVINHRLDDIERKVEN